MRQVNAAWCEAKKLELVVCSDFGRSGAPKKEEIVEDDYMQMVSDSKRKTINNNYPVACQNTRFYAAVCEYGPQRLNFGYKRRTFKALRLTFERLDLAKF